MSPRAGDEGVRILEEAEGMTWVANVQSVLVVVHGCCIGERYLGL